MGPKISAISLTSVVSKMLETIIARGIRKHLDEHKLIRHSQHGFSKGKSCLPNKFIILL